MVRFHMDDEQTPKWVSTITFCLDCNNRPWCGKYLGCGRFFLQSACSHKLYPKLTSFCYVLPLEQVDVRNQQNPLREECMAISPEARANEGGADVIFRTADRATAFGRDSPAAARQPTFCSSFVHGSSQSGISKLQSRHESRPCCQLCSACLSIFIRVKTIVACCDVCTVLSKLCLPTLAK